MDCSRQFGFGNQNSVNGVDQTELKQYNYLSPIENASFITELRQQTKRMQLSENDDTCQTNSVGRPPEKSILENARVKRCDLNLPNGSYWSGDSGDAERGQLLFNTPERTHTRNQARKSRYRLSKHMFTGIDRVVVKNRVNEGNNGKIDARICADTCCLGAKSTMFPTKQVPGESELNGKIENCRTKIEADRAESNYKTVSECESKSSEDSIVINDKVAGDDQFALELVSYKTPKKEIKN